MLLFSQVSTELCFHSSLTLSPPGRLQQPNPSLGPTLRAHPLFFTKTLRFAALKWQTAGPFSGLLRTAERRAMRFTQRLPAIAQWHGPIPLGEPAAEPPYTIQTLLRRRGCMFIPVSTSRSRATSRRARGSLWKLSPEFQRVSALIGSSIL